MQMRSLLVSAPLSKSFLVIPVSRRPVARAVTLAEYLEQVWAAVAKEALAMVFKGADASGFEEDARLTAMWLWTLSSQLNDKSAIPRQKTNRTKRKNPTPVHTEGLCS